MAFLMNSTYIDCTHEIRDQDMGWFTNPTVDAEGNPTEPGMPDTRFSVSCPFRQHTTDPTLIAQQRDDGKISGFKKDLWNLSCDCGTHMVTPLRPVSRPDCTDRIRPLTLNPAMPVRSRTSRWRNLCAPRWWST